MIKLMKVLNLSRLSLKNKNFNFERFISIKTELLKQLYLGGLSLKKPSPFKLTES